MKSSEKIANKKRRSIATFSRILVCICFLSFFVFYIVLASLSKWKNLIRRPNLATFIKPKTFKPSANITESIERVKRGNMAARSIQNQPVV